MGIWMLRGWSGWVKNKWCLGCLKVEFLNCVNGVFSGNRVKAHYLSESFEEHLIVLNLYMQTWVALWNIIIWWELVFLIVYKWLQPQELGLFLHLSQKHLKPPRFLRLLKNKVKIHQGPSYGQWQRVHLSWV